jgi:lipopolysaccharide export system permease protein
MIKKIDQYILRSFAGPFIVTFFIALFILLIQFLWKYIDDLVGKGLEWYIIAELLFYASANLIPLALPLATLLSSIMLYGNLGERFELAALKSAGISMFRFMRSTILMGVCITIGAFLFSNYILPTASLKFWTKMRDITKQKPALNIKPNEFYSEIDGYTILIGSKDEDNVTIHDVTVYEEVKGKQADNILISDRGEMTTSSDKMNLMLTLYDGKQYEQLKPQQRNKKATEYMRMEFGQWEKALDLSGFEMQNSSSDVYQNHYKMMNIRQLTTAVDSLKTTAEKKTEGFIKTIENQFHFNRKPLNETDNTAGLQYRDQFTEVLPADQSKAIVAAATASARNIAGHITTMVESYKSTNNRIIEHKIEVHRKITLSLACLVFLFVGAPLGAIIRKGGFGFPVIFSILIFILFYILNISGERKADESVLTVFNGMWLAIMIIFPFSIFLTIKAKNDAPVFNREWYVNMLTGIMRLLTKRNT